MRISELQSGMSVQKAERPMSDRSTSRTEVQDSVTLSSDARAAKATADTDPYRKAQQQRQEEAAKARAVAKYEAEQKAAEAERELRRVQVGVAMVTPSFLDDR